MQPTVMCVCESNCTEIAIPSRGVKQTKKINTFCIMFFCNILFFLSIHSKNTKFRHRNPLSLEPILMLTIQQLISLTTQGCQCHIDNTVDTLHGLKVGNLR